MRFSGGEGGDGGLFPSWIAVVWVLMWSSEQQTQNSTERESFTLNGGIGNCCKLRLL